MWKAESLAWQLPYRARTKQSAKINFSIHEEMLQCVRAGNSDGLKKALRWLKEQSIDDAMVKRTIDRPDENDGDRNTLLMLASERGDEECVRLLIEAGADVNRINEDEETALMHASKEGHVQIVKDLIAAGADVDAQNDFDETALMFATLWGHEDCLKLLILKGADINKTSKNGKKAWQMGIEQSDFERKESNKELSKKVDRCVELLLARHRELCKSNRRQACTEDPISLECLTSKDKIGINRHDARKCYQIGHAQGADLSDINEDDLKDMRKRWRRLKKLKTDPTTREPFELVDVTRYVKEVIGFHKGGNLK